MTELIIVKTKGQGAPKPDKAKPDPERVLKGKPVTQTWNSNTAEDGRLFTGIWESTPGQVKVKYDEWEFCHIIQGRAVLINEAGKKWVVKKGDAFVIPPGFTGTWETLTKLRKHYVILMPKDA